MGFRCYTFHRSPVSIASHVLSPGGVTILNSIALIHPMERLRRLEASEDKAIGAGGQEAVAAAVDGAVSPGGLET